MQDTIDTMQAELDATKDKVALGDTALQEAEAKITDAAIDTLVAARLEFVQSVETLTDTDITGMTVAEAKRAVVTEMLDMDMTDKSDMYIEVRFDVLLEDGESESLMTKELRKQAKVVVKDKQVVEPTEADKARQRMIERTQAK